MKRRVAILAFVALSTGAAGTGFAADAVPARGEAIYRSVCQSCHGIYARGDGPSLQYFNAHPPDLTDPKVLGTRSDDEVVKGLLERGSRPDTAHSPMVIAGVLKGDSLRDAVHYARSLGVSGKHASIAAGRDIYQTICWTCHGPEGNGKGPSAANLGDAKPRDFTSPAFVIEGREEEVYRTIALGAAKAFHGSTYMLEWQTSLNPQQIRDVMEYIKTFHAPKP